MTEASVLDRIQKWEEKVGLLLHDAQKAALQIGYLRAEIGNQDRARAIGGSRSGAALAISHQAVSMSLAMFCSRAWDQNKKSASLSECVRSLPPAEDLFPHHVFRGALKGSGLLEDDFRQLHGEVREQFGNIRQHDAQEAILCLRNERGAHLSIESNARKNAREHEGREIDRATLSMSIDLAANTVMLIDSLGVLSNTGKGRLAYQIKKSEEHCRKFWRVMPRLADLEN